MEAGSAGGAGETAGAHRSEGGVGDPRPNLKTVFAGLMLGMFLAAVSQTIVAPAMPRIVAQLGGMEHYSWIAVSALLASTVIVPIVGKLSDLYGRKAFYVGGIVVFMASSLVAAVAPSFEVFMVARVLEGFGMGTMMPLSQAIIGDLVPPRERGKYQGLMGGTFGLASVIGPFLGGWITDTLSWHWLFFVNIPLGLVALGFIIPFMRLPHARRPHSIDYAGFVTLTVGLTTVLLATVWGGSEYPWGSPLIVGLFAAGAASLALFLWVETRAAEPVIPPRLWRNDIFATANVASMTVAMSMFGAIYYIPVFVQGVLGASVTGSGAVLTPMMLSIVFMSAATGLLITRTGRYKPPVLAGIALIAAGYLLLSRMTMETPYWHVVRNMVLIGLGLGTVMQTFVLVVQNAVAREDLGVATAATQLFRSVGSTAGTAVLGTILTQRMAAEMGRALPPGTRLPSAGEGGGELGAGAVLDPRMLATLPPEVLDAVRHALAAALHTVFTAGLPFVALAFVAAVLLREVPLRRTVHAEPREAGKELLAEMAQAGEDDAAPVLGSPNPAYRGRAAFLGLVLGLLSEQAEEPGRERLRQIVSRLGEGDEARGRERLDLLSRALLGDSGGGDGADGGSEAPARPAASLARSRAALDGLDPAAQYDRAVADSPPDLRGRLRALLAERGDPGRVLTPDDLETLERIGVAAAAALLLDLEARPGDREPTG